MKHKCDLKWLLGAQWMLEEVAACSRYSSSQQSGVPPQKQLQHRITNDLGLYMRRPHELSSSTPLPTWQHVRAELLMWCSC